MKTSGIAGAAAPKTTLALVSALALAGALAAGGAAAQSVTPECVSGPGRLSNPAAITAPHLNVGSENSLLSPANRDALAALYASLAPVRMPRGALRCPYGRADTNNRAIIVETPHITVKDDLVPGIEALHEGVGHLTIYVHGIDYPVPDDDGDLESPSRPLHSDPLDLGIGIYTTGDPAEYLTGEESHGIYAMHTGEGRVGIDVRSVSIRTTGDWASGVYASQTGSYRFRDNGSSTRAKGAVVINLIEPERDRDMREMTRPLVATRGDDADAVRAEYTGAAAFGHVAVNVEGYTIATGGLVPLGVVATPRAPGRPMIDWTRPWVTNKNYNPGDPNSVPAFNVRLSAELNELWRTSGLRAVLDRFYTTGNEIFPPYALSAPLDIRPHTIVYLPVRNPDYNPDDPDPINDPDDAAYDEDHPNSKPFIASPTTGPALVWNGRYFRALDPTLSEDARTCAAMTDDTDRAKCFKDNIYDLNRDSGNPTGFLSRGIYATHGGHGDIRVSADDSHILTWGAQAPGIYATHTGRTRTVALEGGGADVTPGGGGVSIKVVDGIIGTFGEDSHGVWGRHRGDSGLDAADGAGAYGAVGDGGVDIELTRTAIGTQGRHARGVYGLIQQFCAMTDADDRCVEFVEGTGVGDIVIDIAGGAVVTGVPVTATDVDVQQGIGDVHAYAVQARHENRGDIAVTLTGVRAETAGESAHGVFAEHGGFQGDVAVTVDGGSVTTKGVDAHGVYATHGAEIVRVANGATTTARGAGALTVRIANGATVATEGVGATGVRARTNGGGDLTMELAGDIATKGEGADAVFALQNGAGALSVSVTGGEIRADGGLPGDDPLNDESAGPAHGLHVTRAGAGNISIDISGGAVVEAKDEHSAGVLAYVGSLGALHVTTVTDTRRPAGALADGAISITVGEGASVFGGYAGIQLRSNAAANAIRVDGTVTGREWPAILMTGGGMATIGETGRVVSRNDATAIEFNGEHAVTARVAGTVEGHIRAVGAGALTAAVTGTGRVEGDIDADGALTFESLAGGVVTGTVFDPVSPLTVHGSVGRLLYTAGGAVTVAATGRVTGVEGESAPIRATAGDLTAAVAGRVEGDIRADAGVLTFVSPEGGAVAGTVHKPAGALTVHGSVGRLLYDDGGAVTVAATGRVTGVDGETIRADSGTLAVAVAGTVEGDLRPPTGGELTFESLEGGVVTGTVHDPAGPLTVHGTVGRLLYDDGGEVTVARTGRLTGIGGESIRAASGTLVVTVAGRVEGDIRPPTGGALTFISQTDSMVTGTVHDAASPLVVRGSVGRLLYSAGGTVIVAGTGRIPGVERDSIVAATGDLSVTVVGAGMIGGDIRADDGRLELSLPAGSSVAGTVRNPVSLENVRGAIGRLLYDTGGTVVVPDGVQLTGVVIDGEREAIRNEMGDLTVTATDTIVGSIVNRGAGALTVTISRAMMGDIRGEGTGSVTATVAGEMTGSIRAESGDLTATVSGALTGDILARGAGDLAATVSGTVMGGIRGEGAGEHTVVVAPGGTVTGTVHLDASTVVTAGSVGRVLYERGGTVSVADTGRIAGVAGMAEAIRSNAGNLVVDVAGSAMGDVLGAGAGDLTATVSGSVAGDVRKDGAGDLAATISGSVAGDVRKDGAGDLTAMVPGSVGGEIVLAGSDGILTADIAGDLGGGLNGAGDVMAMISGAVGGGLGAGGAMNATVSGAVAGGITGAGDLTAMISGAVGGGLQAGGALAATVSGSVGGGVTALGAGAHTVAVARGGTVAGTVQLASGAVTAAGSVGRVVYEQGGSVTVVDTGRIAGVAGMAEAIHGKAGNLAVDVAGSAMGDVLGAGDGALTAMVSGSVAGDVRKAGDGALTATVSGSVAGDVLKDGAGDMAATVPGSVGGAVVLAGSDGALTADIAGQVGGGLRSAGDLRAMVSGAIGGDLRAGGAMNATVSGSVAGGVHAMGADPAVIRVAPGGAVAGDIRAAARTDGVMVDGSAGRVLLDRGGEFQVGERGEITGIDGVAARSESGELVAVVRHTADESRIDALRRAFDSDGDDRFAAIVETGGAPQVWTEEGGERRLVGTPGTPGAVAGGARDIGIAADSGGQYRLVRDFAPRSRLYEALPTALLIMNAPPEAWDRARASRDANGAWARFEAGGGKWQADSTTAGVEYDHRRWGARTGLDVPIGGEDGGVSIGVSAHRFEGLAIVSDGGDIETRGTGVGLSASWRMDGAYADAQAVATWYDADLVSISRGALNKDLSGRGYALGIEAGRRISLSDLPGDTALVPRARLEGSEVSVSGFSSDTANARVSVDDARSVKGRLGVRMETAPDPLARLAGSLDIEHELAGDVDTRVSSLSGSSRDTLSTRAEKTWVRVGLSAEHGLVDGAFSIEGQVDYARSMGGAWDVGGGVNLKVRF